MSTSRNAIHDILRDSIHDLFSPSPVIRLRQEEQQAYSISRAILSAADASPSFETDVSQEIARRLPVNVTCHGGGFFVPTFMITRAGLDSKTTNKGVELIFTEAGSLIEALRAKTRVIALGAVFLPGLRDNISFPKLALGTVSQWVSENPGVDQAAAEETFAASNIILKPSSLTSPSILFSRQLLQQSSPAIDRIVTDDIALANAAAIDKAALHGSGVSPEPQGIYAANGVNSIAFGGPISYAKVVKMETAVGTVNADVGPMGYITTPEVRENARLTENFPGSGVGPLWEGDNETGLMNYYAAVATNQISKTLGVGLDEHGIVFGAWSNLIVGEWGATEVLVDPFRLKKQGMLEVQSFALAGIALRHGESFAKGTGLTIS